MRAQTLQEQLTQADEQLRGLEDRRDAVVSEAQLAYGIRNQSWSD